MRLLHHPLGITAIFCAMPLVACQTKSEAPAPTPAPVASTSASVLAPDAASEATAARPLEPIAAPPDVASPPADAAKSKSGLASKLLQPGTGKDHPTLNDRVRVHFTGWTADGRMFDSSVARGQPIVFPMKAVMKGWTEGMQLMVAKEKRRFWLPSDLAYGDTATRADAPAGPLTFDIELLDIMKVPATPPDVAAAPPTAKKTASGIAYRVLTPGKDKRQPKETDIVDVNYTGWTTDGQVFDSSVARGQPATMPVNGPTRGWSEALRLMHVGERARFWIPANSSGDAPREPGGPAGMLVFDIELLAIH